LEHKGYERYGLTGNPFRDLASETLETVDIFHVKQDLDEHLKMIFDEIVEKQSKAVVAVLGNLGMGKTQRLLLTASWAKGEKGKPPKAFYVMRSINPQAKLVVRDIVRSIMDTIPLTFYEKNISTPKWYADLKRSHKKARKKFDPEMIGKSIAAALNAKAPSILMLNDLHNIDPTNELPDFLQVLYSTVNNIREGVMIMIGSNTSYFDGIMKRHQSLEERINYKLEVQPLSDTEAQEMIAKRLAYKRLVEDLNPIYPFNNEAISIVNQESYGNPRQVLKISDRIIDQAASERIIQIDGQYVSDLLESAREKRALPPAPSDILEKLRQEAALRNKPAPSIPPAAVPAPSNLRRPDGPNNIDPELDRKFSEYEKVLEKVEKEIKKGSATKRTVAKPGQVGVLPPQEIPERPQVALPGVEPIGPPEVEGEETPAVIIYKRIPLQRKGVEDIVIPEPPWKRAEGLDAEPKSNEGPGPFANGNKDVLSKYRSIGPQ